MDVCRSRRAGGAPEPGSSVAERTFGPRDMPEVLYSSCAVAELLISTPEGKVLANLRLDPMRAYWVGRDSHCDVVIENSAVSRRHALIFHVNGRWMACDAGSTGGLDMEMGAVRAAQLSADAWVRVGSVYLWLAAAGNAAPDWIDAKPDSLATGRPDQIVRLTNESLSTEPMGEVKETLVVTDAFGVVHLCADLSGLAASTGSGSPRLTVGRSTAVDLQICDSSLDPVHCVLTLGSEYWSIVDAGSASGLLYDGKRWFRKRLEDGITMPIGRFRVSIQRIVRTTGPVVSITSGLRASGSEPAARKPSAFLGDGDADDVIKL